VAWNVVDHLVKLEGFNSRVMGTWILMLMVAKGQIAGTESVTREPLVAEWRSDAVPMGGEEEGRKGAAPEGGFARRKGGGRRSEGDQDPDV
jgi:hypothetical protein